MSDNKTRVSIADSDDLKEDPVSDNVDDIANNNEDGNEDDYAPGPSLEDYEDDEEIWPNGPTVGIAKAWKAEFGRVVVGTLDNGDHYVIRPLNRTEYRNHIISLEKMRNAMGGQNQSLETLNTEEAITRIGLLFPELSDQDIKNFGPAGFPTLVSQQILEISGFVAIDTTEL